MQVLIRLFIKLFFIKKSLQKFSNSSSYCSDEYNFVIENIKEIINIIGLLEPILEQIKVKESFLDIQRTLEDINKALDEIMFCYLRMKYSPDNFYIILNEKTRDFIKMLDGIEYINIFKYY